MKSEGTMIFKLIEKDNKLKLKENTTNSLINFILTLPEMVTIAAQCRHIRKGFNKTGIIDKNGINTQILIRY